MADKPRLLQQIKAHYERGNQLLNALSDSVPDFNDLRSKIVAWAKAAKKLAQRAGHGEIFSERYYYPSSSVYPLPTPDDWRSGLGSDLRGALYELEEIIRLLEGSEVAAAESAPLDRKSVFVVHGHNEAVRQRVARFLEKLGLKAIILHEQSNKGQTLIEKFEAHANVGYAVVLFTADDLGKAARDDELRPRARQNVVFEAGFFMGKLGRERVALLYEQGVELPSDLQGFVYTELDDAGGWEKELLVELRNAEMEVSEERWLGSPK